MNHMSCNLHVIENLNARNVRLVNRKKKIGFCSTLDTKVRLNSQVKDWKTASLKVGPCRSHQVNRNQQL